MLASAATALLLSASLALADFLPTSPDASTTCVVGQNCQALWNADTAGTWANMTIQLMTGPNLNMVPITNVGERINAATATSFSFVTPNVQPYSRIYFLQFTPVAGSNAGVEWTTRFTITAQGTTASTPANATQPGSGDAIPWGIGALASPYSVSGSTSNSTAPSTGASSAVASASSAASSLVVAASSGVVASASGAASSVRASASSARASASAAVSSVGGTSGASTKASVVGGSVVAVVVGGAALAMSLF